MIRCMKWVLRLVGWPLLLLHFFVPGPYNEQILSVQTILLTLTPGVESYHVATGICLVLYLLDPVPVIEWQSQLIHHILVFACVLCEYFFREWRWTCWLVLFWSVRWMNPLNIYLSDPLRAVLRCVLFGSVTYSQFTLESGFRWCWLFFVHELFIIFVPFQMLYSVYGMRRIVRENDEAV
jgi:hypothetical protein